MEETRPRLLVKGYAETRYDITGFEGRFYATHQEDGAFEIEKFRAGATKFPAYAGNTIDEVIRRIEARDPLRSAADARRLPSAVRFQRAAPGVRDDLGADAADRRRAGDDRGL